MIRRHIIVHGTVEVEVQGADDAVERMLEWLGRGPQFAEVSRLDVNELEPRDETGFSIR